MIAHQFEHPEVFALLMQRSPNWLRLINAAEVGDETYFRRIIADHPQLFQKLSLLAASLAWPYATIPAPLNSFFPQAGLPALQWRTVRRLSTLLLGAAMSKWFDTLLLMTPPSTSLKPTQNKF